MHSVQVKDAEIRKRLKEACATLGMKQYKVTEEAIKEWLERHETATSK